MSKFSIWINNTISVLLNSNLFKLLNTQIIAAIIGASITILGVWITIRNERKMRFKERKDEIKPAISINFIGLSDEIKQMKNNDFKNILTNTYSYEFSPILNDIATLGSGLISGYTPNIGRYLKNCRKANILLDVHVDGNFPVTDIKMTNIKVTDKNSPGAINDNRPISFGISLEYKDSIFDFYRKHIPRNFSRSDENDMPFNIIDSNNYNKYISPNENILIKVPLRIGSTPLSKLIELIKTDKEFMKKENILDYNIPFGDPEILYLFLSNLNTYPVQITLSFEYKDIEENIYIQNVQCFAYFSINFFPKSGDYIITPSMTTKGLINSKLDDDQLKDFIYNQFDNAFFNMRRYVDNIDETVLTKEEKKNYLSQLKKNKSKEELNSIYDEIHNVVRTNEENVLINNKNKFVEYLDCMEEKELLSKKSKDVLLLKMKNTENLEDIKFLYLLTEQLISLD